MCTKLCFTVALILASLTVHAVRAQEQATRPQPLVFVVQLEDVSITPVTAQFLARGIKEAEAQQADCLIVVLDTPGGLVDSTRQIIKDILGADVPVVVFVSPRGARAASAGGNSYHEAIRMKFEDFRRLEKPKVGVFVADG